MRKFVNTVFAAALGLSMVAGISAEDFDDGEASINVGLNDESGGVTVLIEQAPSFGEVDYSVETETHTSVAPDGSLIIRVTYDVGDDKGWNLTIKGGDFESDTDVNEDVIEIENLKLGTGAVTKPTDAPGTIGNVDPTAGNGLVMGEGNQNLVSAEENLGSNGIFFVTYTGNSLTVPGGTPVNVYTSTITVTSGTAP